MERLLASGGPARWGILCNGRRIRLLKRDVVAGRQRYFEVDLEALFYNQNEQDAQRKEQGFDTFWTLFRAQSFQPHTDGRCLLDVLDEESRKHAEGVSSSLKTSVFQALDKLMSSLVSRANELLNLPPTDDVREQRRREIARQALDDLPALYTQSLVFLYRLLFVLYAESRDLLPLDNAIYRDSYSLEPLRREIEVPILINQCGRARIIDGFAGPGEYEDGQIGSPLIALQTLLTHPDKKVQDAIHKGTVELIFIERDPRRSEHLQRLLTEQKQNRADVPKLQPSIITGTFLEKMEKLLTLMEHQNNINRPIPTFVFIDPFGYSHAPLSIIRRIMSLPMCEVLVNFMYDEINRFLGVSDPVRQQYYDRLFGTDQWRQVAQQSANADERRNLLHDLYRHQLLSAGKARYVRSFQMRNKYNATDYFLFFGTNSIRGLEEMKRAMWGVDQTGGFEFSDFSNPYQPLLLTEPNYADLQRLLANQFKGQIASIAAIKEYVLAETPYVIFKKEALRPMELTSKLRVINPPSKRKKGTFPNDDMLIEFL